VDAPRLARDRGLIGSTRAVDPRGRVARSPGGCHDAGAVPTYDYQCRSCGAVTEVIHAMTEDGPTVCEQCGGVLRRVLYPAGIIFKGSGFYRTDSRATSSSSVDGGGGKKPTGSGASGSSGDASPSSSTDGGSSKVPTSDPSGSSNTSSGSTSSGTSGSSGGESAA
jgi:putative FmdB family regulatory protein